jgi:quercetin dioxygenase-like cupin family protein
MNNRGGIVSVESLASELLEEARGHQSRRAARTVVSGTSLRATLIALTEGAELGEHDAPPAAMLQLVVGTARLHTRGQEWVLATGQLVATPPERHGLTALTDTVALLTVALR